MNIAKDFNEFTFKAVNATANTLNSEAGQELVNALREQALIKNPQMTEAEWAKIKQDFLVFMFFNLMKENPDLMKEMGEHLFNELNKSEK